MQYMLNTKRKEIITIVIQSLIVIVVYCNSSSVIDRNQINTLFFYFKLEQMSKRSPVIGPLLPLSVSTLPRLQKRVFLVFL